MPASAQPDKGQWLRLCTDIATALERDREAWFANCLRMVAEVKRKGLPIEFEVTNSTLGGEADLALRAYQLIQAMRLMSVRKYVPPSEGQDFADLLFAQVCGTRLYEVLEVAERYRKRQKEEASLFALDVAGHILGGDSVAALGLSLEIMMLTPQLTAHTAIMIAATFGDDDTVRDFDAQLLRMRERMR